MKIMKIIKSPHKNKRYRIILDNNDYYDFGLLNGSTYIDHHNVKLRDNYKKRHYVLEKKFIDNYIPSPALFSYYILWGDSIDINKNINTLNKYLN